MGYRKKEWLVEQLLTASRQSPSWEGVGDINTLWLLSIGQPNFFWDFRLKLHGEVWAKTCLETNFQPIPKSFDHVTEAPKVQKTSELAEN